MITCINQAMLHPCLSTIQKPIVKKNIFFKRVLVYSVQAATYKHYAFSAYKCAEIEKMQAVSEEDRGNCKYHVDAIL